MRTRLLVSSSAACAAAYCATTFCPDSVSAPDIYAPPEDSNAVFAFCASSSFSRSISISYSIPLKVLLFCFPPVSMNLISRSIAASSFLFTESISLLRSVYSCVGIFSSLRASTFSLRVSTFRVCSAYWLLSLANAFACFCNAVFALSPIPETDSAMRRAAVSISFVPATNPSSVIVVSITMVPSACPIKSSPYSHFSSASISFFCSSVKIFLMLTISAFSRSNSRSHFSSFLCLAFFCRIANT